VRDTRYEWAYIFGAACPARGVGAALVLPRADTGAMNLHLDEIAGTVTPGAHAVVLLDGAGWHGGDRLRVPHNLTLLKLPPYAPELNGAENIWEYMRKNDLSNRLYDGYPQIIDACCGAWQSFIAKPDLVRSLTARSWANVS
jgi:DDE superfamily endonuclease